MECPRSVHDGPFVQVVMFVHETSALIHTDIYVGDMCECCSEAVCTYPPDLNWEWSDDDKRYIEKYDNDMWSEIIRKVFHVNEILLRWCRYVDCTVLTLRHW